MAHQKLSWWQQVMSWTERQRDARTIRRALKPYLVRKDGRQTFVPQPPREDLEEACRTALMGIHDFPRIVMWGNSDQVPDWPFQTVGKKLTYHFHRQYLVPLGDRREWLTETLQRLIHRRWGHYHLPTTLYGRDTTWEILIHFAAASLHGTIDPRLTLLLELASSGNEPTYIGGTLLDRDVLYVRCELTAPSRTVEPAASTVRTVLSIPRPVPT